MCALKELSTLQYSSYNLCVPHSRTLVLHDYKMKKQRIRKEENNSTAKRITERILNRTERLGSDINP